MKKFYILSTVAAIAIIVLSVFLYLNVQKKNTYFELVNSTDKRLIFYIGQAQSSFGADFSKIQDVNEKNRLYEQCIVNVASAGALTEVSSIQNKNEILDLAFIGLYQAMIDPKYRDQIMKDSKKIHDLIAKVAEDPYNLESTEKLSLYVKDLRSLSK